jgi:vancomycin permeability regulator SanA
MIVIRLMRSLLWRIAMLGFLMVLTSVIFYVYVHKAVNSAVQGKIIASIAALPYNETEMVLGAQVYSRIDPSPVLAQRLATAAKIINEGKAKVVLMSGDGRAEDYNEVITMRNYAVKIGIAKSQIQIDDLGLRTYDSCWRAKNVFKFTKLTIVTQRAHLVRAVYTCQQLGLDVVGAEVPATGNAPTLSGYLYEEAALMLAWLDLHVFQPLP